MHLITRRFRRPRAPKCPDQLTRAQDAREALRYPRRLQPMRRHQVASDTRLSTCRAIVANARSTVKQQTARAHWWIAANSSLERIGFQLAVWGDFRLPPGGDIAGYRLWFIRRAAAI